MDALALLCNLHGDGPATLAALRAEGASDLAGLERLSDERLEELLGGAAPSVGRFRREARLLIERIGEADEDEVQRREPAPQVAAPSSSVPSDLIHPANEPEPERFELQDEARHEVLPDPELPELPGEPDPAPAATPEPARDLVPHGVPSATTLVTPAVRPEPAAPAGDHDPVVTAVLGLWNHLDSGPRMADNGTLAESRLDGLRPEEVVLLAQAGIRTLNELAEADTLRISKRIAISFTHLDHLRFLARKLLRSSGSPAPSVQPAVAAEPAEQPADVELSQPDLPAGGPFA